MLENKVVKLSTLICCCALLISCSNDRSDHESDSNGSASSGIDIIGTWRSSCHPKDEYIAELTFFADGSFTDVASFFTEPNCDGKNIGTVKWTGTYLIGENLTTDSGLTAYELDMVEATSDDFGSAPLYLEELFITIVYRDADTLYFGVERESQRVTQLDFDWPFPQE